MEKKVNGIDKKFFNDLLVLGYMIDCVDRKGLNPNSEETFGTSMLNTNLAILRPIAFAQLLDKFLMEHEFVDDYHVEKKRISSYFASTNIDASKILEFLDLGKYKEKVEIQIPNLDTKIKLLEAVAADNEKWYKKTYMQLKQEPEVLDFEDNEVVAGIQRDIEENRAKYEKLKTMLEPNDEILVALDKKIKMLEHKKQMEVAKLIDVKKKDSKDHRAELLELLKQNGFEDVDVSSIKFNGSSDVEEEDKEEKQDKSKRRKIKAKVKKNVSSERSKGRIKRGLKWLGSKIHELSSKVKEFLYPEDDYYGDEVDELKTDEKVPATEGNLSQDDEMFLAAFDEIEKNEEKGRHR